MMKSFLYLKLLNLIENRWNDLQNPIVRTVLLRVVHIVRGQIEVLLMVDLFRDGW